MIYPKFLNDNSLIGTTAPSLGASKEEDIKRLEKAKENFKKYKLDVIETPNTRISSIDPKDNLKKCHELEELLENKLVEGIIFTGGGEFMLELLSLFNFKKLVENPKWLQGYSDPTTILYTATTKYDIATIYGNNIKTFGMIPLHNSLKNNIEILKGNIISQNNFNYYEESETEDNNPYKPYNLNAKVKWKIITKEKIINTSGRIIGGCIDILTDLFGTKYDNTKNFIDKYQDDGIIWYFDNCELTSEKLILTLWKFKDAGYFNHTKCIIFGRTLTNKSNLGISFEDAIIRTIGELNIPIVCGADIGHVPPKITIINGSIANIYVDNKQAKIDFILK